MHKHRCKSRQRIAEPFMAIETCICGAMRKVTMWGSKRMSSDVWAQPPEQPERRMDGKA
jgi:hypothetical protein